MKLTNKSIKYFKNTLRDYIEYFETQVREIDNNQTYHVIR